MKNFEPAWNTIPAFLEATPLDVYHKERMPEAAEKKQAEQGHAAATAAPASDSRANETKETPLSAALKQTGAQAEPLRNLHVLARAVFRYRNDGTACACDTIEPNPQTDGAEVNGDTGVFKSAEKKRMETESGKTVSAPVILRITADDYYKLYVNGTYVGQGPAPAYPEHSYYNEIDLAPFLRDGENCIAVHLYYQGLKNRVWNSGDNRFGLAAVIGDDTELEWRYQISRAYSGDTIGYETQFLENFDSRKWDAAWNMPEYDDAAWEPMVRIPYEKARERFGYTWQKQPTRLLAVTERKASHIRCQTLPDGREDWALDFGQELVGNLKIQAEGASGAQVHIYCGEECGEDGNVRYEMRCNCRYEEVWTLDSGVCTWVPYDYKGFRYARVTADAGVKILAVSAEERHYPLDETLCTWTSSSAPLDQIFQICKRGVICGTQEGYLDCPTREKGQYLGDAVITAHSQVWLSGSVEMLRKCIDQFAQTTRICPGLMAVAPGAFMQEIADFSLMWSQLLLFDYQFTGDKEFLRRYYPTACGVVKHFAQYARGDGLLEAVSDKWNIVDWPKNLRDNYDFPLIWPKTAPGCHNVINALYIGAVKTLCEIEEILGIAQTHDWKALAQTFHRTFFRTDQQAYADSETSTHCALHSNVYPLFFGLVPKPHEQHIADYLIEKGLCCGVLVSYFYLKALARAGRYDAVYGTILNETEHGWIEMLREGATTCWEAWGKEQKGNTSLCHPWSSAPVSVLIEDIAGFVPDPDAPEGFRFAPHVPDTLRELRVHVPFRGARYCIEKENGAVTLREVRA